MTNGAKRAGTTSERGTSEHAACSGHATASERAASNRRATSSRRLAIATLLGFAVGSSGACVVPECATPSYSRAECRVIAENQYARLETSTGIKVRFLTAGSRRMTDWDATGLLAERPDGSVDARVAGLGAFTLAVQRNDADADTLTVHLANVDARTEVAIGPDGALVPVDPPSAGITTRPLDIPLPDARPVFVEGSLACPQRYRIAVTADIQTNPDQFARIVDTLADEWATADPDEPLVGLILVGDLSEASRDEEFEQIHELLDRVPVGVAVTTGNHDIYRPARPHFTRNFGPGNHAFSICRTRVTMLDSGSGSLAQSVVGRLPELLDPAGADFSIAAMHHPPYAGWTGAGWSREDQAAVFLAEAALAGTDLIVNGHAHALVDFDDVPVGGTTIHEIIAGTAGATQGDGPPRYGYVRLTFGETISACFVEVLPPGYGESPNPTPKMGRCAD